jgi:predicted PurR-regulated permease PerM
MTVKLDVETKTLMKVFSIAVLFVVGMLALVRMYDALILVTTALFFALALNPAVSFLSKYVPKKRRGPAVAVVMMVAFALLSVLIFSITTPVAREASDFAENVPQRVDELRSEDNIVGRTINKYNLDDDIDRAFESGRENIDEFAQGAVNKAGQFGSSLLATVTGVVITILMLLNGPRMLKGFADGVYKDKKLRERHEDMLGKMYNIVTGYVNGQVVVAFIAAMFALGAMFLLKVPYPLPLASIVFVLGLIPLVGNTIAAVLVVLFTMLLKDFTSALLLGLFFVLYQQIENATLQPMVQAKTTKLPTLVIFVSVILGVALIGPIGGLFAIPAAGCAKVLLNDYLDHRDEKSSSKTPKDLAGKIKHHVKKAVS